MNVHQNILIRITSTPYNIIDQRAVFFDNIINEIVVLEKNKIFLSELILDELHLFNQNVNDGTLQRKIQNYRRILFNNKDSNIDILNVHEIPEEIKVNIRNLVEVKNDMNELINNFEIEYSKALAANRNQIKVGASQDLFLNGLFMASHSIFQATIKYLELNHQIFNKKQLNTERSIVKYLSRTAAKTSPFSTLTSLCMGRLFDFPTGNYLEVNSLKTSSTISYFRVNNFLQKTFKSLLSNDLHILKQFCVTINSTIEVKNQLITFLVNRNNVEFFQEIEMNSVLDEILSYFKKENSVKFVFLLEKLAENIDSSREELEHYIMKLVNNGMFHIDFGVSGIDANWLSSMVFKLKKTFNYEVPFKVSKLIDLLNFLMLSCDSLGRLEFVDRSKLLSDVESKILEIINLFNKDNFNNEDFGPSWPKPIKSERMFFEDSIKDIDIVVSKSKIQKAGALLYQLNQNIDIVDFNKTENIKMYDFFDSKYDELGSVRLIDFYKDFYKNVKSKENKESLSSEKGVPTMKHSLDEMQHLELLAFWKQKLISIIEFPNQPDEPIHFSLTHLEKANSEVGFIPDLNKKRSVAGFIQVPIGSHIDELKDELVVLNSLFSGYGKMFSRFLHLFPENVTETLKRDIQKGQPTNSIFAELQDSSYHNANLHPNLLPYEISIPGGHSSLPNNKQIIISDILISKNKKEKRLNLIHQPTGRVIYPFDLGFQSTNGRSKLYSLLNKFTYGNFNTPIVIANLINNELFSRNIDSDIIILPRIIYENKICIHRKAWLIKTSIVPKRMIGEGDSLYYLNILKWKLSISLPDTIFMRVVIKAVQQNLKYPQMKEDDYKPQYINFNSPLLVSIFEKLLGSAGAYIQIDEMLPDRDSLLNVNDSKHVTELYVQIDG